MKERWESLTLREKQKILLGSIFVILFLSYEFLISPLNHAMDTLHAQVTHKQELLAWMKNANHRIENFAQHAKQKTPITESILSLIQNEINQRPLSTQVTQLRQTENNAVEIHFQQVNFDDLMRMLIDLGNQYNLVVPQLSVIPSVNAGEVDATVVIRA